MIAKHYAKRICHLKSCGVTFQANSSRQKFCCPEHRLEQQKITAKSKPPKAKEKPQPVVKSTRIYRDHVCGASLQVLPEGQFVQTINRILSGETLLLRTRGDLPEEFGLVARQYETHTTKPATRRPL